MNTKIEQQVRPRVGVSSCLLGQEVRFDGGHKLDKFVRDKLGTYLILSPWCPELAIGLGMPRKPIRLAGDELAPRVVGTDNPDLDVTKPLQDYAEHVAAEAPDLSGYIFKKGSPSCGMERVKVYRGKGVPTGKGVGQYAARLMSLRPELPCEEEGRLNDPALRESFVERIFVMARWQQLCRDPGLSAARLVDFHTRHKYLALSHAEVEYRELGRMVANAGRADIETLGSEYIALLMRALKRRATRRRHANVLHHLLGFLRDRLDSSARAELVLLIDEYRQEHIPLVVPIRFLRYQFDRHPNEFVAMQYYLRPYPDALGVRNHL